MSSEQIVLWLIENQVIVVVGIGFLIVFAYLVSRLPSSEKRAEDEEPVFQNGKTAEEIVKPNLKKILRRKGDDVGVDYYEGKKFQGHILKERKRTEADEPIKIKVKNLGSEDTETENIKRIRIFLVSDSGSKIKRGFGKVKNGLKSITGGETGGHIEVITEDLIKTENEEKIVLKPNIEWDYDAGLWIATDTATQNVKKRAIVNETLNNLLAEIPGYVDKVNEINPFQSMATQREKAKKDEETSINIGS